MFNQTQGRKFNVGLEYEVDTHNVFLFIISKETPYFQKVLKEKFNCDFVLLKFESPFKHFKLDGVLKKSEYCEMDIDAIKMDRATDFSGLIKYNDVDTYEIQL